MCTSGQDTNRPREVREVSSAASRVLTAGWRQLPNENLRNLFTSQNITGVIERIRMGGAAHIAHT